MYAQMASSRLGHSTVHCLVQHGMLGIQCMQSLVIVQAVQVCASNNPACQAAFMDICILHAMGQAEPPHVRLCSSGRLARMMHWPHPAATTAFLKAWLKLQVALVQVERNLHDAMGVARNVMMDPRLVPGGGAVEMAVSRGLSDRAAAVVGPEQVRRERAPGCRVHQRYNRAFSR